MAGSESVDIIRKASLASGNMRTHAAFRKGLREKETSGISYLHATSSCLLRRSPHFRNVNTTTTTTRGVKSDSQ
jgi:hypothetical protein